MKLPNRFVLLSLTSFFFLSGFAGLIYESIWSHYLKLFVGHAAYAQTLVLVIYMGGMACGSWLAARYSRKMPHLLVWYAGIEIVVGCTALLFHQVFVKYLDVSYSTVLPALGSAFLINVYKWGTASLLILPQTILLGATFPLMTGGILRLSSKDPGRSISLLYFVNSLGGALGVLVSGFYLIEKFTFPGTVRCAGIIDIIVGAGVLLIWKYGQRADRQTLQLQKKESLVNKQPAVPIDRAGGAMLVVAALTAAASFIYEVGWIRMLSLVLGSSTHSFELMLSAFILGLAIGGFWIRKRLDTLQNPLTALAVIQLVMGFFAVATLFFYSNLFYLMQFFMNSLSRTDQGYVMFHLYSHIICLILMLPATIPAGMTLPLITWYLYKRNADEAMIGRVYASNTLGSIAGVLLAIQVLMPLAGLKVLLIIGGTIDMLIGLLIIIRMEEPAKKRLAAVFTTIILAVVIGTVAVVNFDPSLLSSGVFRYGEIYKNDGIIYYRDGKTSSVSVRKVPRGYQLVNNGKTDASVGFDTTLATPDEYTQILLAVYPLAYAQKCDRTAIIGLGSGMTASVLLQSDAVQKVDVIEIEKYVVEGARLMGPKVQKVFVDPRSTIHIDDAKTFFSTHPEPYDCIISEPSNPWVSGVSSLFSLEFFDHVARHLSPGGMLVQWFHLYEMSPDLIASIIMTIDKKFTDYKAFVSGTDMILLASNSPIKNVPVYPSTGNPHLASYLQQIKLEHWYDFRSNYVGGREALFDIVSMIDIPVNSDYNPVLDLRAVKARITNATSREFSSMNSFIIPVRKLVEGDTLGEIHEMSGRVFDRNNTNTVLMSSDYDAWQAWWYVKSIGTAKEGMVDSAIARNVALKVGMVRMAAAPGSSIAARQMVPKYIVDLLKITMPYLPPEQMADIWNFIDATCGEHQFPQKVTDIQTVLRHASANTFTDSTRMLCRGLLGEGPIDNNEYNRMAVIAFIIASARCNTFEGVQDVWNRIGSMRFDFNCMMAYNYAYRAVRK